MAKPFLKWAGGKTKLIKQIADNPKLLAISKEPFTYVEPFVGSGAILFWMLEKFPNLQKAVINDINSDLINCYKTIKNNVNSLISLLSKWQEEYYNILNNPNATKTYYYQKRNQFNTRESDTITQSALFIFLNKTCFNGLFRVNKNNEFNVPIGRYKKPLICQKSNLLAVSKVLQKVEILNEDYCKTLPYMDDNSFFYLDPPYKPISKTSSFTSYSKDKFDDEEQIRLKRFCDTLTQQNCQWILSNSDVRAKDLNNNFFDDLFADFTITRVNVPRSINVDPNKRGQITELLIFN